MTPTPEQLARLKTLLAFRDEASSLHTINMACEQLLQVAEIHLPALIANTERLAAVRAECERELSITTGELSALVDARRILSIIDAGNP
jgi:DNA-binding transcriptional MerR regulator